MPSPSGSRSATPGRQASPDSCAASGPAYAFTGIHDAVPVALAAASDRLTASRNGQFEIVAGLVADADPAVSIDDTFNGWTALMVAAERD